MFRLRWVSGPDFFLELPYTDIDGHDIGIGKDESFYFDLFRYRPLN